MSAGKHTTIDTLYKLETSQMTNEDEAKSNQGGRTLRLYKGQNSLTCLSWILLFSAFHFFDNKGTTKVNLKENYSIMFKFQKQY